MSDLSQNRPKRNRPSANQARNALIVPDTSTTPACSAYREAARDFWDERKSLARELAEWDDTDTPEPEAEESARPQRPKLPPLAPCPPGKKRCRRCLKAKPLEAFYGKKQAKDGKQERCKACDKKRDRVRDSADNRRPPRRFICSLCASQPWRVKGRKNTPCKACGLRKAPERVTVP